MTAFSIETENEVTYVDKWVIYCDKNATDVNLKNDTRGIACETFRNHRSLTSITVPDGIISIDSMPFSGCSSLTSITLPDSITSIYSGAFAFCSNLKSVTLGNGVTSIYSYVFSGCSSLKNINFNGTKAQWKAIKKMSGWYDDNADFTVNCTDGKLDKNENEIV